MVPISRVLIINSPYSTQVMSTQSADKAGFILLKPPESCTPQINVHRLPSARPYMNFYCTNVLYIGFISLHIYKFNRYKKISHLTFNLHSFCFCFATLFIFLVYASVNGFLIQPKTSTQPSRFYCSIGF